MAECIDIKVGKLIHGYELGILSEDELELFEKHLMVCDYCLDQVQSFKHVIDEMMNPDLISGITEDSQDTGTAENELKRSPFTATAIAWMAAAALVLIVGTATVVSTLSNQSGIRTVGSITLANVRTSSERTLNLSEEGEASIIFAFPGAFPDSLYSIEISTGSGETVYTEGDFSAFDEFGFGTLYLRDGSIVPAEYELKIYGPVKSGESRSVIYKFNVE